MLRVPCARTAGRPIQLLSSVVKWLRVGVELQYCYSRARCSTRQQWSPARLASTAPECRMRWLAQVEAPDADEASEFSPEEDFEDEALDADDEELYGDRLPAQEVPPPHAPRQRRTPSRRLPSRLTTASSSLPPSEHARTDQGRAFGAFSFAFTSLECSLQTNEEQDEDEEFGDADDNEDVRVLHRRNCYLSWRWSLPVVCSHAGRRRRGRGGRRRG